MCGFEVDDEYIDENIERFKESEFIGQLSGVKCHKSNNGECVNEGVFSIGLTENQCKELWKEFSGHRYRQDTGNEIVTIKFKPEINTGIDKLILFIKKKNW